MKVVLLLFIGLLTELLPSHGQKSGDMAKKSADRSKDIQQSLYAVLRTMALPDGAVKKGTPVSQRFVLQVSICSNRKRSSRIVQFLTAMKRT